jgi:CMP-2-keto-3-deoxyoctulosonic acid synthetase
VKKINLKKVEKIVLSSTLSAMKQSSTYSATLQSAAAMAKVELGDKELVINITGDSEEIHKGSNLIVIYELNKEAFYSFACHEANQSLHWVSFPSRKFETLENMALNAIRWLNESS